MFVIISLIIKNDSLHLSGDIRNRFSSTDSRSLCAFGCSSLNAKRIAAKTGNKILAAKVRQSDGKCKESWLERWLERFGVKMLPKWENAVIGWNVTNYRVNYDVLLSCIQSVRFFVGCFVRVMPLGNHVLARNLLRAFSLSNISLHDLSI